MQRINSFLLILFFGLILVGCHKHDFKGEVTAPTCTEQGYTTYTCKCGKDTYKDNYVDALGHSYSEWIVVKEATETEKGLKEKVCSRCNDKVEEEIPVTSHKHNYTEEVTAPTCTTKGYTTYTCSCGDSYQGNEIEALGHSYSEWIVAKEATETEKGLKEKVCSRCNDKVEEEIPVTSHEHNYTEEVIIPTCTTKGYTKYTCSCGDSYQGNEVEALGHYEEVIVGTKATCTEKGLTDGKQCPICDEVLVKQTEIEALGHSYGEWTVTKEATETEKGLKEKVCSKCNDKIEEEIPELSHEHSYTEKVVAPTCVDKGYTLHTCSCGDNYKDNEKEALGHKEEVVAGKAATCTEDGLTEGKKCSVCSKVLKQQEIIKLLGHNYSEWKVVKEATETEKGLKEKVCSRCNDKVEEIIPLNESDKKINETIKYLNEFFNNIATINSSIDLPKENSTYATTISYSSSNNDVFSNEGIFTRPYKNTTIILTATISDGIKIRTNEFIIDVKGYKNSKNKAASYVYTNYSKVDDQYFETMDIIYCSFVLIDVDGNFTGKDGLGTSINNTNEKYLEYMQKYIISNAHEQGDWVIVSVGGGGKAYDLAFEEICKSEEKMNTLASNIVSLINQYGFDGVDIDWEVPDDGTLFTKLMQKIYTAVKNNNPNHLVTAAIGGGKWQPPKYDLTNSKQYMDYINLMTYNMTTSNGQHHSALYKSKTKFDSKNNVAYTLTSCSIEESVDFYYSQYAIEPTQLIIGATFYAIKQTRVDSSSDWKYIGTISYDKLKTDYLNDLEYDYYYDTNCQAPYLLSKDRLTFISFDDETSLKAKCKYVQDKNCAGIMYWQNGQDTSGDLVKAIKEGLAK